MTASHFTTPSRAAESVRRLPPRGPAHFGLAVNPEAAESKLDFGQLSDPLLLRVRDAVLGGVIPVNAKDGEAADLLGLSDKRVDELAVLNMDPIAERCTSHTGGR